MINTFEILRNIPWSGNPAAEKLPQLAELLTAVSSRAGELDDPKLNALMCRLGLYSIADPASPDYNPGMVERVIAQAEAGPMTFGQQLKRERIRLGLTQRGAAHILEINERTYQNYERDDAKAKPSGLTQEAAIARLARLATPSAAFA